MTHSLKQSFYSKSFIKKKNKFNTKAKKNLIVTWFRASTIIPIMIGHIIDIHNEKEYLPIYIIDRIVSHKLNRICTYSQFPGTCKK